MKRLVGVVAGLFLLGFGLLPFRSTLPPRAQPAPTAVAAAPAAVARLDFVFPFLAALEDEELAGATPGLLPAGLEVMLGSLGEGSSDILGMPADPGFLLVGSAEVERLLPVPVAQGPLSTPLTALPMPRTMSNDGPPVVSTQPVLPSPQSFLVRPDPTACAPAPALAPAPTYAYVYQQPYAAPAPPAAYAYAPPYAPPAAPYMPAYGYPGYGGMPYPAPYGPFDPGMSYGYGAAGPMGPGFPGYGYGRGPAYGVLPCSYGEGYPIPMGYGAGGNCCGMGCPGFCPPPRHRGFFGRLKDRFCGRSPDDDCGDAYTCYMVYERPKRGLLARLFHCKERVYMPVSSMGGYGCGGPPCFGGYGGF